MSHFGQRMSHLWSLTRPGNDHKWDIPLPRGSSTGVDIDATSTFSVDVMTNDWSIQQIAKLAGTTSRTLRHYDELGLLTPSGVGANGYRRYDAAALVRLQRILLLRELGLGLEQIAEVLRRSEAEVAALRRVLQAGVANDA